jgi:hypothetical protein
MRVMLVYKRRLNGVALALDSVRIIEGYYTVHIHGHPSITPYLLVAAPARETTIHLDRTQSLPASPRE